MVPEKHEEDGLNEHHLRRLLVSCQYIDHLLSEIENVLNTANSQGVFPKYFIDISPAERQLIEKHEARIRRQLLRLVQRHGITYQPGIPARRAIHSILAVAQISAEELNPRHLRGYGKVPESAAAVLKPLVGELQDLIAALDQFVTNAHGHSAEPEH
ncbi:MAG: hypothetical protein ACLPXM_14610 [Terriglobales bacterium]